MTGSAGHAHDEQSEWTFASLSEYDVPKSVCSWGIFYMERECTSNHNLPCKINKMMYKYNIFTLYALAQSMHIEIDEGIFCLSI